MTSNILNSFATPNPDDSPMENDVAPLDTLPVADARGDPLSYYAFPRLGYPLSRMKALFASVDKRIEIKDEDALETENSSLENMLNAQGRNSGQCHAYGLQCKVNNYIARTQLNPNDPNVPRVQCFHRPINLNESTGIETDFAIGRSSRAPKMSKDTDVCNYAPMWYNKKVIGYKYFCPGNSGASTIDSYCIVTKPMAAVEHSDPKTITADLPRVPHLDEIQVLPEISYDDWGRWTEQPDKTANFWDWTTVPMDR